MTLLIRQSSRLEGKHASLIAKLNEAIQIGDDIEVKIISVDGDQVKIGIDAPKAYRNSPQGNLFGDPGRKQPGRFHLKRFACEIILTKKVRIFLFLL